MESDNDDDRAFDVEKQKMADDAIWGMRLWYAILVCAVGVRSWCALLVCAFGDAIVVCAFAENFSERTRLIRSLSFSF